MIEEKVVLDLLKDIKESLESENWKNRTISTLKQYRKGISISIDPELKQLIEDGKEYSEGSYNWLKNSKRIDRIIRKINGKKI